MVTDDSQRAVLRAGPRERRRWVLGWTLSALGLLVVAVWVQSAWWYRGYETGWWAVSCHRGVLSTNDALGWKPPAPGMTPFSGKGIVSFPTGSGYGSWRWTLDADLAPVTSFYGDAVEYESSARLVGTYTIAASPWRVQTATGVLVSPGGAPVRVVNIAFWPVVPLLVLPGALLLALAWKERRRRRRNLCGTCGYSRAGLAMDACCPECGAATPSPVRSSRTSG